MSTMKAKHYQLIALALAGTRPDFDYDMYMEQWVTDCRAIADVLEAENPNKFDRNRFLALCGALQ